MLGREEMIQRYECKMWSKPKLKRVRKAKSLPFDDTAATEAKDEKRKMPVEGLVHEDQSLSPMNHKA